LFLYGEFVMRKIIILLGIVALTICYSESYAQNVTIEAFHPEVMGAFVPNSVPETNKQYDDLGSSVLVYSLIIGIYTLYWFRQKA